MSLEDFFINKCLKKTKLDQNKAQVSNGWSKDRYVIKEKDKDSLIFNF